MVGSGWFDQYTIQNSSPVGKRPSYSSASLSKACGYITFAFLEDDSKHVQTSVGMEIAERKVRIMKSLEFAKDSNAATFRRVNAEGEEVARGLMIRPGIERRRRQKRTRI